MSDQSAHLTAVLAGRYVIERELGRGGMATVYLAADLKHDRQVALKVLHPELASGLGPERFLREIKLAARLSHPHILPLFDSGEAEGLLYYVMPYVEGESLRQRLVRERQLPIEDALRITREVGDALGYAHSFGFVHRDIKPENILLSHRHAVVADFGIARAITEASGDKLTETGLTLGTPSYMSPEQAAGENEVDARSDQYSLGCVLYEMLVGDPPFLGHSAQRILARHVMDPVPPPRTVRTTVPLGVERALLQALAKAPADRYATVLQFADALEASGASEPETATPAPATGSIAVLPFLNMSPDPENEYFADGMAEEIINALTKVEGLRVTARSSAFSFKGKNADVGEIGRRLKVATVLEGSVRRSGNRIRVTAELVSVVGGYHLWSECYDREMAEVFAIQDEISHAIVGMLKVKLMGEQDAPLVQRHTENLEAYSVYLKGRFFWNRRTPDELRKSIALFGQAHDLDPSYALPYAGEADAYGVLGWWADLPPGVAFPAARRAAAQALALAPGLAEAHASQAFARLYHDWEWATAEVDFTRSIELNPKYPTARQWYAQHLIAAGRSEEALCQARLAEELDPLSLVIMGSRAMVLYYAGRYDDAIAQATRALDLEPNFAGALCQRGLASLQLGKHEDAIASLRKAGQASHFRTMFSAQLAYAHARAGDRGAALAILTDLRRAAAEHYVSPYELASCHAGLGDRDAALDALEAACAERSSQMVFLPVDPLFQDLRSEPRFRALLARLGASGR